MSNKLKVRVLTVIAAAVAAILVSDVVSNIPAPGDGRTVWAVLLSVAAFVVLLAPQPAQDRTNESPR